MIRQAETQDLPELIIMFQALLSYMKDSEVNIFCHDEPNRYVGGMMEYLVGKSQASGHVIMVKSENDKLVGFLIGMVEQFPAFHKHQRTALLEYLYPVTFGSTPLAHAFYDWAKEQGATTITCLMQIVQDRFLPMYQRQGFDVKQIVLVKEL
jgi:hypothetical protein